MANKYDLLLINTSNDRVIRDKPWYKERIRTKMIKSLKPGTTAKLLNTKNWTFVKDGLDDFRDGLPPPEHDGDLIERPKGPAPILTGVGSKETISQVKDTVNRYRFTKDDVCYSKLTPLQKQRRDHIDEIEYGLLQHPLALYPHLEEGVPPDLFEDIVDLLDPEMNIASEDEDDEFDLENQDQVAYDQGGSASQGREALRRDSNISQTAEGHVRENESAAKNPYKWLPKKEEQARKNRRKVADKRPASPSQDAHIKDVTQDFCHWVTGLGGESNNIEESTIYSLFASGYETKPALSVPIHVVELTNVPPELRMSAVVPEEEDATKTASKSQYKKAEWKYSFGSYEPSCAKFRYGAWYLPAKTWKRMTVDEPLLDPKQVKEQDQTEMKKKSDALDSELAPIHGSAAFMEFINKKDCRKPEFLTRVSEIQKKHQQEEEKQRYEQELKARQVAHRLANNA